MPISGSALNANGIQISGRFDPDCLPSLGILFSAWTRAAAATAVSGSDNETVVLSDFSDKLPRIRLLYRRLYKENLIVQLHFNPSKKTLSL